MKWLSKSGVSWTLTLVIVLAAFVAGYLSNRAGPEVPDDHGAMEAAEDEIWSCSMDPQVKSPKPGLCPICGMDLVPLSSIGSAGSSDNPREISLSEKARKLAQVRTEEVLRGPAFKEIRLFGKVALDETELAHITAWVPGRIEKLYVDFTGTFVKQGEPLAEFYSPDLLVAQEELLQSIRARERLEESKNEATVDTARETVEAVRKKLTLWGLTDAQVGEIEERGTPSDRITILAPINGTVIDKDAEEGLYVAVGTCLFTLSNLTQVWIKLDAYEYDIRWIETGLEVNFQVEAYPGDTFTGSVAFIDPVLDEATRSVKVRLDVSNTEKKLKPGMFVRAMVFVEIKEDGGDPLLIPASAALVTGKRSLVYVALPEKEGAYEGREVVLGPRVGDRYVVRQGLAEGEEIVVNGNFKIDSALQLLAKPSMMDYEGDDR